MVLLLRAMVLDQVQGAEVIVVQVSPVPVPPLLEAAATVPVTWPELIGVPLMVVLVVEVVDNLLE